MMCVVVSMYLDVILERQHVEQHVEHRYDHRNAWPIRMRKAQSTGEEQEQYLV
jgi:hypothetical protein